MDFINLAPKENPVHFLYNLLIRTTEKIFPVLGIFSAKLKRFRIGRQDLFARLQVKIAPEDKTIWIHAASLGEYEQAVPVIHSLRTLFPQHKLVVSFFSPSGYEIKKDTSLVDVVTYLPLDTPEHASTFLDLVHPDWTLMIKYEFWPNFLRELQSRKARALLISGVFRKEQVFFRPYGRWMRGYLNAFEHFFVQDEGSASLLRSIDLNKVTVSGDTRFDRVYQQKDQDNTLAFIDEFLAGEPCIVAGSTWPEDENLLTRVINNINTNLKFVIAPHNLDTGQLKKLQDQLQVPNILYSEKEGAGLAQYKVLILNTIGMLSRAYSYADIAYVGGAVGNTGLHNILEPATFGIPIITGNNFKKFPEALHLQELGGLLSISTSKDLKGILEVLATDDEFRTKTGRIAGGFVERNTGATKKITDYLSTNRQK